jgi:hypothetical protein
MKPGRRRISGSAPATRAAVAGSLAGSASGRAQKHDVQHDSEGTRLLVKLRPQDEQIIASVSLFLPQLRAGSSHAKAKWRAGEWRGVRDCDRGSRRVASYNHGYERGGPALVPIFSRRGAGSCSRARIAITVEDGSSLWPTLTAFWRAEARPAGASRLWATPRGRGCSAHDKERNHERP